MSRRKGKRVAMWVAGLGLLVTVAVGLVFKDHLLLPWYESRLRGEPDAVENWALARKLEALGERGRAAAEKWYIEGFYRWTKRSHFDNMLAAIESLGRIRSRKAAPVLSQLVSSFTLEGCDGTLPGQNGKDGIVLYGVRGSPAVSGKAWSPGKDVFLPPPFLLQASGRVHRAAVEALKKIENSNALPRP